MRMEFVRGKVVLREKKSDKWILEGEEFMEAMERALFSKQRVTKGAFRYIFARPKKVPIDGEDFLYSEIAKVRHNWRQDKIIWEEKDYEEQNIADIVEGQWPFVISPDRDIILRRFGETVDFLETFRAFFSRLCVKCNRNLIVANIGYVVDERDPVEITHAMESISVIDLRRMRMPNPVVTKDYEPYYRVLLDKQRATEASTEFRNEETDEGLNVDVGSLLRSGLAGAHLGYGEWEVEGYTQGQRQSIRKTERIWEAIEDVGRSIKDDVGRMARLMIDILNRIKGRP